MKLGERMKSYENINKRFLAQGLPAIIRIDGVAFHTFTKGMKTPYDELFQKTMRETMVDLCGEIQGSKLAYQQSDEISIILIANTEKSELWFNGNIQKIESVGAATATLSFNKHFRKNIEDLGNKLIWNEEDFKYRNIIEAKADKAKFDCRVSTLPENEVVNYFIWRQQDATRNSIQSAGRNYFSNKQLKNLSCKQIQDKLMLEQNINWNSYPSSFKRGVCAVKTKITLENSDTVRNRWVIDDEIPIFTKDRNYIIDKVFHIEM